MARQCSRGAKAGFALAPAEGALGELASSSVAKKMAAAAEQLLRREQRAKDVADMRETHAGRGAATGADGAALARGAGCCTGGACRQGWGGAGVPPVNEIIRTTLGALKPAPLEGPELRGSWKVNEKGGKLNCSRVSLKCELEGVFLRENCWRSRYSLLLPGQKVKPTKTVHKLKHCGESQAEIDRLLVSQP